MNGYIIPKDILGLWEQTVCEIRDEIKAQDTPALVYAKELCDKLEHSMSALAGGPYELRYQLDETMPNLIRDPSGQMLFGGR